MFPDLKMFPSAVATCTDCCQPETLTWAYWGSDTKVWLTAYMTGGISSKSLSYFSHHCQGWSHHITDYVLMLWIFPAKGGSLLCNRSSKSHSLSDPYRSWSSYICISVVSFRDFIGSSGFTRAMNAKPLEFLLDQKDLKRYKHTIREMQIITTVSYHYIPTRMAKLWSTGTKSLNIKCRWGCGVMGTLIHCWWECQKRKKSRATLGFFFNYIHIYSII